MCVRAPVCAHLWKWRIDGSVRGTGSTTVLAPSREQDYESGTQATVGREQGRNGVRSEEGRAQNSTSVPLRPLASRNGGNDGTCTAEFLTSKIYTRKNLQPH